MPRAGGHQDGHAKGVGQFKKILLFLMHVCLQKRDYSSQRVQLLKILHEDK